MEEKLVKENETGTGSKVEVVSNLIGGQPPIATAALRIRNMQIAAKVDEETHSITTYVKFEIDGPPGQLDDVLLAIKNGVPVKTAFASRQAPLPLAWLDKPKADKGEAPGTPVCTTLGKPCDGQRLLTSCADCKDPARKDKIGPGAPGTVQAVHAQETAEKTERAKGKRKKMTQAEVSDIVGPVVAAAQAKPLVFAKGAGGAPEVNAAPGNAGALAETPAQAAARKLKEREGGDIKQK
jgi:hypothetical protein